MQRIVEIPDAYQEVILRYAQRDGTTVETAFSNLMDFIQLKDAAFSQVLILVEDPLDYVTDAAGMEDLDALQVYMDLFGEDNVGATARAYYHRDRMDVLFLQIAYEQEVPVWNLLELFYYKIPGMDILPDGTLELLYLHDGYSDQKDELEKILAELEETNWEVEGHSRAGYYENIFDEEDEEAEETVFDEEDEAEEVVFDEVDR